VDTALDNLRIAAEHAVAAEKDAPNTTMKTLRLVDVNDTRADVFMAAKRWQDAIGEMKLNAAAYEELLGHDPGNPQFLAGVPPVYAKMADCHAGAGDRESARKAMQTAMDRWAAVEAKRPLTAAESQSREESRAKLAGWQ
jgi:hypothetical protein